MAMISDHQAYAAMYYFLKQFCERNNEHHLGSLISDMSLLPDGDTADIAIKQEWAEAVGFAMAGGQADALTFAKSKK